MKPQFQNKPNQQIEKDGKTYWISRSVAIEAFIFARGKDNQIRLLMTKRSDTMMDAPGKYSIPCGYLDYNENSLEALIREVYEETGLYLPDCSGNIIEADFDRPSMVLTEPYMNRQNVVLCYKELYDFSKAGNFPYYVENYTSDETSLVKWITIEECEKMQYDIAFGQYGRIRYIWNDLNFKYNGITTCSLL